MTKIDPSNRTDDSTTLIHPKYRPDIDGLRAIAVLAVVLYHAFANYLPGGFVGVDVFFVISGFLISKILLESLQKNTFSFGEFYSRRTRRIFPTLGLILIFTIVAAWIYLIPNEFKQLGRHVYSSIGFLQNFNLWKESGYFDTSSELKPLLHLWSLGLEEQFYLVWPLVLFFVFRAFKGSKSRQMGSLIAILVLGFISFYLSICEIKVNPVKTFYLPQTRFWELLSGSLLAWCTLYKKKLFSFSNQKMQTVASGLGLALIVTPFFYYSRETSFPGPSALPPVIGTFILIAVGPGAHINRKFLSHRWLTWVGLVSFPLYLWHWPLFSFARILSKGDPSAVVWIALIIGSVILAKLTVVFIERPLRLGGRNFAKVSGLVCILIAVGAFGAVSDFNNGWPSRFKDKGPAGERILKISNEWINNEYSVPANFYPGRSKEYSRVGSHEKAKVYLLGDSHVEQYQSAFAEYKETEPGLVFNHFAPFPIKIESELLNDKDVKVVVLSYYWTFKYRHATASYGNKIAELKQVDLRQSHRTKSEAEMDAIDEQFLLETKKLITAGKKVAFVLDNPFGSELDRQSVLVRSWNGVHAPTGVTLSRADAEERRLPAKLRVLEIARQTHSQVIDPFDFLCSKDACPIFSDEGELLYKDHNHLSAFALTYNALAFVNRIKSLAQ